jgi:hypothetical protein
MLRTLIAILTTIILTTLAACAPRVAIRPIPADTRPEAVLDMLRQKEAGLDGLRAFAKVTIRKPGETSRSFEAILYVAKPGRIRFTGISFLGSTAFDAILTGETYYFSQPSTGYVESGPRDEFPEMLRAMGTEVDPEAVYSAMFSSPPGGFHRNFIEKTQDGYSHYLLTESGGVLAPSIRADYDAGLNLVSKTFYDETGTASMTASMDGVMDVDGYKLPGAVAVKRITDGAETVIVEFEKYLINPEGIDEDFAIPGM